MDKLKVLFLAANPTDTSHLKLDEEIRLISEKIRASEHRDSLELISAWAVRPDDLLQLLNTHKPHVVHFSGHGSSVGEIILVDNSGHSKPVSTQALRALFTTLKDNIRIVVLNSCYSQEQAKAISEVIDYIVGVHNTIGDDTAVIFAASFYRAIGFNRSIQEAFDQAQTAVLLEGVQQYGIDFLPLLFVRKGADATQSMFVTDQNADIALLLQYRKIFERPAFSVPCIHELFLGELLEAIDDTQAALNTGSLYSRSGKLLAVFPSKDNL